MSVETDVGTPYNTDTTDASSKKEDRKQMLGLLFLYGLGAALVITLRLL